MDRMTNLLMAAIAAGLFLNVAVHTIQPARADDEGELNWRIEQNILNVLQTIADGTCHNNKLCGR